MPCGRRRSAAASSYPRRSRSALRGDHRRGEPCQRKLLRFVTPDGRRWCNAHAPKDAEPDRLYVGPTKVTVPCAGVLRDGRPCEKRGTMDGDDRRRGEAPLLLASPGLGAAPRPEASASEAQAGRDGRLEEIVPPEPAHLPLTPLPPEGEHAAAATNGNTPRTLRERVEDTTEALYEDIERGLREALTNATKARKTRCPSCQETFEVRLPDHGASISAAKSLLDLVVSRPEARARAEPRRARGRGLRPQQALDPQLRRYLQLTEEDVIERLDEETLEEKVERVVDVAERFMADPRDVSPGEVTEAKALLASMRHYDRALAPIRKLRSNWRVPLEPESDIPPAPRTLE